MVILSELLSTDFELNSSTVRNVLRGWIAHGDIAAVWMAEPLTSSTAVCLLKTCHQANFVGFCADLNSDTTVSLSGIVFCQPACSSGYVCFWPTVQETFHAVLCQRSSALEAGSTP